VHRACCLCHCQPAWLQLLVPMWCPAKDCIGTANELEPRAGFFLALAKDCQADVSMLLICIPMWKLLVGQTPTPLVC